MKTVKLMLSALLLAPGMAQAQTDPAVGVGQALVELNCSRCHAVGLTGESPHVMAPPFRTLTERYPIDALEEAFASGHITSAHPDMPDFTASAEQIADIIAYIASIQAK